MRWLVWLLFACSHVLAADEKPPDGKKNETKKEKKQPGYGDANFHVHLKGLRTNEGQLEPSFESYNSGTYTIRIDDPTIDEVVLTPILNLRKYQPRFTPKITLNDEVVEYAPIRTIEVPIALNQSFSGFDQDFELTVADPEAGYIIGNTMTYYIKIIQDPSPHVTDMTKLKVKDYDGNDIYQVNSTHTNRFTFITNPDVKKVYIDFACQPHEDAVVMRINGHDAYTPYELALDLSSSDVCLTCAYVDDEFTPDGEISRTYLVEVQRNETLGDVALSLNAIPRIGHCQMDTDTHWHCSSHYKNFQLIASWNVTDATLLITDTATGVEFHMINNIPTIVELDSGSHSYDITLSAGEHIRKYAMDVTLVGTKTGLVLEDLPVLLGLWWGQGDCSKVGKKYVCWVKQERINLVVHFSQSDRITAKWKMVDQYGAPSTLDIEMGMPSPAFDIEPGVEKHLTLSLKSGKDSVEYAVGINRSDGGKHDNLRKSAESHPMSVEEENRRKREEQLEKMKKAQRKSLGTTMLNAVFNKNSDGKSDGDSKNGDGDRFSKDSKDSKDSKNRKSDGDGDDSKIEGKEKEEKTHFLFW